MAAAERPPPEKEVARRARDGAAKPDLLKRNSSKRQIRDGAGQRQPSLRQLRAARAFLAPSRRGRR
jgi:hypothetical protein